LAGRGAYFAARAEFFGALLAGGLNVPTPGPVSAEEPGMAPLAPAADAVFGEREFFISGTSTQEARQFAAAAKRNKTPVFSLPQELAWGAEFTPAAVAAVAQRVAAGFGGHSRVVLTVGLPSVRDVEIARKLSKCVVSVAERVMRMVPMTRVFAEGGATAAELVRRMGWPRLTVRRELAPGVATLAVEDGEAILLTIKPGTYSLPAQWTSGLVVW